MGAVGGGGGGGGCGEPVADAAWFLAKNFLDPAFSESLNDLKLFFAASAKGGAEALGTGDSVAPLASAPELKTLLKSDILGSKF